MYSMYSDTRCIDALQIVSIPSCVLQYGDISIYHQSLNTTNILYIINYYQRILKNSSNAMLLAPEQYKIPNVPTSTLHIIYTHPGA